VNYIKLFQGLDNLGKSLRYFDSDEDEDDPSNLTSNKPTDNQMKWKATKNQPKRQYKRRFKESAYSSHERTETGT